MNFLSVPLKSTNEVDLVKPLQNYVDSILQVNSDLKTEISEGIVELNKLRTKACVQPLDKHQSSLDLLTKYYDQLTAIDNKLPITSSQNLVSFKWKDAFDKGSLFGKRASLTTSDISFERAAVLFNIGALMSAIASSQKCNSDEEFKTVAKLFQQSAGVFAKLTDSVSNLIQQEPTPDLMPETLAALSALMVSQAQEIIYTKASKDKMKPTALVKISAQCAEFYRDAQRLMSREAVNGIWDKEWNSYINGKALAIGALAQYHAGQISEEIKEIGEQIARLSEAKKLMERANSYLGPSVYSVEYATIKEDLKQAKNDNDLIYLQKVHEFHDLPALPKAELAKILPVQHPLSPNFQDLFSSLVPVAVREALANFEARKNQLIDSEIARMHEHTHKMNSILVSLNLPAALDDAINYERCPESIRQKSNKVKTTGGIKAIQSKFDAISILSKQKNEALDEVVRLLNEEKLTDDNLRLKLGKKWEREPSERLTGQLRKEIEKYRGIMDVAAKADVTTAKRFEDEKNGIEKLTVSEDELANLIPSCHSSDEKNSMAVRKLMALINNLHTIKLGRENLEKSLKDVHFNMTDDFMRALTDTGIIEEKEMSIAKIDELYGPFKKEITALIKEQEDILTNIQIWNSKFVQEKGSGDAEREKVLKELAASHDAYFELEGNLNAGLKFYNDLTPRLERLQRIASEFCFVRQEEKKDLLKQIQQNIISGYGQ